VRVDGGGTAMEAARRRRRWRQLQIRRQHTAAVVAAGGTTRRDKSQRDATQKVPLIFQTNEKVHLPYCFEQTERTRHRI